MFYSWNVIGHEKELLQIEADLMQNNLSHAYLFTGPSKIGKFRIARSMAGILQCPNNFCHTCPTCIQIEKGCHLDTIELSDDGESIKINTIRDIINRLNMTGHSKYKILLIQNIDRLTDEAANCILKTLEEPTGKTIFIFTATQINDVMPTIISRMRGVKFKKLPDHVLKQALKERHPEIDKETLDQIILLSLGRSGSAIRLLSNTESFQELKEMYRNIEFLVETASISARMLPMQDLSRDPKKTEIFLSLLAYYIRKKMLQSDSFKSKQRSMEIIKELHRAIDLLKRNVNPRLLLENIMIKL